MGRIIVVWGLFAKFGIMNEMDSKNQNLWKHKFDQVGFIYRNELVQDQKGIQIISDVSCVDSTFCLTINEKVPKTIVLSIKNNSSDSCELKHCELLKRIRVFQLDDDHGVTESQATMNILPGL